MSEAFEPLARPRAPRLGAAETSLAKSVLRPLAEKMPEWHAMAAKLAARAQRRSAKGERDAGDAAELEALEREIRTGRDELVAALVAAPEGVRHHSRVEDIFKAIDRLLTVTEAARGLASPGRLNG